MNPKIVSEMLGHASISITLDTYSHVLPDMQAHPTAEMDAALDLEAAALHLSPSTDAQERQLGNRP